MIRPVNRRRSLPPRTVYCQSSSHRVNVVEKEAMAKQRFCETNKCAIFLLVLVILCIGIVALVTFVAKGIRVKVTEEEDAVPWWKTTVVYQVYPRSFQDTNDDGTGDIQGIIRHLDYFNYLNVGAIWLSPFYKSPMKDFGYDVSDYRHVDPIFGNMTDFEELIEKAHSKNIKVIVDFVPNHCSDQHQWFQWSRANKTNPYRDYFIWHPGRRLANGTVVPPNNWMSVFDGSAWKQDSGTGEFYYHAFLDSQPDLNYRNEAVLKELDGVLRFWLEKGVDGFRVDAIPYLFEQQNISMNEPEDQKNNGNDPTIHPYTKSQPEIFGIVERWKSILDEYKNKDGKERLIVSETVGISDADRLKYYKAGTIPFFFDLISTDQKKCDGKCIRDFVARGLQIGENNWPNFVIGNHDNSRISTRWGSQYVDAMNMLLLTLPGVPTTYYGEEIGMTDVKYSHSEIQDPYAKTSGNDLNSRDPCRSPMQWDDSTNAGFSAHTPWLRINPDYISRNVQAQKNVSRSSLSIYRRLTSLRQRKAFQNTNIQLPNETSVTNIFSYIRGVPGEKYLVIINFGKVKDGVSLDHGYSEGSVKVTTGSGSLSTLLDKTISFSKISLEPGEGMVILLQQETSRFRETPLH